jgi:pyruvate dehydrogenase E2 component (dihydrolipoamide acetyltransferase)
LPGIILPNLGYATSESTILRWLKAVGEPLAAGEALVETASEKTVHVVAAEHGGTLLAIYAPPGAIVPEGETIGWIGAAGEEAPRLQCRLVGWESEVAPPPENLAALLSPGGEGGSPGPTPAVSPAEPRRSVDRQYRAVLRGQLRKVTAQRMAKSWRDAPKVDLFAEVDFSRTEAHRRALKEQGREAPSFNVYIAHGVVKAFQDLPAFNFHLIEGRLIPLKEISVGIAVALGDNLVTVSLKNLAGADVFEIQRRFKGLIRKALQMSLRHDELFGSSLTVTNLGEFDISAFTAVINPPEVFILAIGQVEERVVPRDGAVTIAPMCTFCLSFDHRAIDGAPASRLLQRIKHHMEHDPIPL